MLYVNDDKDLSMPALLTGAEATPTQHIPCRPCVDVLWMQGMQDWTFVKMKFIYTVLERATQGLGHG